MSLQVCRIKGYGVKLEYGENIFTHINDKDKEQEFLEILKLDYSYYSLKKRISDDAFFAVIMDGMNGEYKYVMYITEVSYIENTHGDDYWCNKYRDDKWIREYAKENIEIVMGRDVGELHEIDFKHYS